MQGNGNENVYDRGNYNSSSAFCAVELIRAKMSLVMRKPDFCICEEKGADQLRSYSCAVTDQRLCFRYI